MYFFFFVHLLRFTTHHCALFLYFSISLYFSLSLFQSFLFRPFRASPFSLSSFTTYILRLRKSSLFLVSHSLSHPHTFPSTIIVSFHNLLRMHIIRTLLRTHEVEGKKNEIRLAIFRSYDRGVSKCAEKVFVRQLIKFFLATAASVVFTALAKSLNRELRITCITISIAYIVLQHNHFEYSKS